MRIGSLKTVGVITLVLALVGCRQKHSVRGNVVEAFGGSEALRQLDTISYAIDTERFADGHTTRQTRYYTISIKNRSISEWTDAARSEAGLVRSAGSDSAEHAKDAYGNLFYNFLFLLNEERATWREIGSRLYKNRRCIVFEVSDPERVLDPIHLFVDASTYLIVTSSIPSDGKYTYFADESDYQEIPCLHVQFPLTFSVVRQGKVVVRGRFHDFCGG